MGSSRAAPEAWVLRARRPIVVVAALWAYALTFGLLALAGIQLLDLLVGASGLRTVMEVAIMAAAALAGTWLSVPALRISRRFWMRELDWHPNRVPGARMTNTDR